MTLKPCFSAEAITLTRIRPHSASFFARLGWALSPPGRLWAVYRRRRCACLRGERLTASAVATLLGDFPLILTPAAGLHGRRHREAQDRPLGLVRPTFAAYTATAVREGRWWVIDVDDVDVTG
jgi:hypothetical protein